MALNFDEGLKIAVVEGLPAGHNKDKLYLSDDKTNGLQDIVLKKGKFIPTFNKSQERITASIFGMAGSGKSYLCAELVKQYHKVWPKNDIYLFSEKVNDEVFDSLGYVNRVNMDSLLENPLDYNADIPDSCLLIFDDVDGYGKKLKKVVYSLRDKCLKLGRSRKISVFSTDHSCVGIDMKSVLNETNYFFFFPFINWNRSYKYLCESYLGLTNDVLEKMGSMEESRWVLYQKNFPSVLMGQTWALVLGGKRKFK